MFTLSETNNFAPKTFAAVQTRHIGLSFPAFFMVDSDKYPWALQLSYARIS
jgi:hypothetical protein